MVKEAPCPKIKILSLDPASRKTGWAILTCSEEYEHPKLIDCGCISSGKKFPNERMEVITDGISTILSDNTIDYVFMEKATKINYGGRRRMAPNAFKTYCQAVEAVHQTCRILISKDKIFGATAPTWKASEKKATTIKHVNEQFDLELTEDDDDVADAIAMGVWFINRQRCNPIPIYAKSTM